MNEGLKYNTSRDNLTMPEYGRSVQQMINHLHEIGDRDKRSEAARFIVSVMAQMNPQAKDRDDYMHKLWDHLFLIAGDNLDVDSPYERPEKDKKAAVPDKLDYNKDNPDYGQYGKLILEMIERVAAMEEGKDRQLISVMLANQMKRSYLNWNKSMVSDSIIIGDLRRLSGGRLNLPEDTRLIFASEVLGKTNTQQPKKKQKKQNNQKQNNKKQKNNP